VYKRQREEIDPSISLRDQAETVAPVEIGAVVSVADATTRVTTFSVVFNGEKATSPQMVELASSDVGFSSTIMTGDQRMFEIHWNVDGSVWEQTPAERLDIIRLTDGRDLYRYTNRLSGTSTELLDDGTVAEDGWYAFFNPATLNYNPDGDRLALVLTSSSVEKQLSKVFPQIGDKKPNATQTLCGLAGTVGQLKCIFGGGVANCLCHVAVGVSVCCAIMDLCS
jgi:hypothetical protein